MGDYLQWACRLARWLAVGWSRRRARVWLPAAATDAYADVGPFGRRLKGDCERFSECGGRYRRPHLTGSPVAAY